jgi:UDP-N-acetylglucosamine:LPS N-acetylglucosamine transferase
MTQALSVLESFEGHKVFLVTNDFPTVEGFSQKGIEKTYYLKFFGFNLFETIMTCLCNSFIFISILFKEKPGIIFSTGSDITVPAFYLGKFLFRCKLVYLESWERVRTSSLNARLAYWISDLFLVQWESQLSGFGKKAKYLGRVL